MVPIYEYKCDDCGRITELLENSGNKGERKCAHCGSRKLKKQFSVFSRRSKKGNRKNVSGAAIIAAHIREGNKKTMDEKIGIYDFNAIEKKWQQNWEADKTFAAVDCDESKPKILCPRYVPVSKCAGFARGAS